MKKRAVGILCLASVVIIGGTWWSGGLPRNRISARPEVTAAARDMRASIDGAADQIDLASMSQESIVTEVRHRDARDSQWEWKTRITFFGKVLDEEDRPVANADIYFQWTNLSPEGTQSRTSKSNEQGTFSLDDVQGKRLLVRVGKTGYYSSDPRNHTSFEYSNPFEEIFHRPNPSSPVVFRLRKQKPSQALMFFKVEAMAPVDGTPVRLNLDTGKTDPNGQLELRVWKPWPPKPMSPPYDWRIVLTLIGGGFVSAPEHFAFEAPELGYETTFTVAMSAASASTWRVSIDRSLYFVFAEPKRYGRLALRTDGNSRYVFCEYVINQSGRRDLEDASATR